MVSLLRWTFPFFHHILSPRITTITKFRSKITKVQKFRKESEIHSLSLHNSKWRGPRNSKLGSYLKIPFDSSPRLNFPPVWTHGDASFKRKIQKENSKANGVTQRAENRVKITRPEAQPGPVTGGNKSREIPRGSRGRPRDPIMLLIDNKTVVLTRQLVSPRLIGN